MLKFKKHWTKPLRGEEICQGNMTKVWLDHDFGGSTTTWAMTLLMPVYKPAWPWQCQGAWSCQCHQAWLCQSKSPTIGWISSLLAPRQCAWLSVATSKKGLQHQRQLESFMYQNMLACCHWDSIQTPSMHRTLAMSVCWGFGLWNFYSFTCQRQVPLSGFLQAAAA